MEFTFVEFIGHLAFLLTAVSFGLKDILLLRFLAIVSALVGIGYNYYMPVGPLWLPIFWLGVFTTINVWRIIGILTERYSIQFNEDERELYETVFKNFAPVEFMKLMRIAEWREAEEGNVFAAEGTPVEGLRLLFSGEVRVERDGAEIGRARDGALIGEMSFIQGGNASATVTANAPCRYVFWPGQSLRGLLRRNPNIDVAMKNVFSLDLTRKLTGSNTGTVHMSEVG
ncbi:MAG: cyclic nucleotide-binding domain-containing protein [Pseudomonadota bacterium]|nr:cyclic nucleotide-binding domain-containing protein [Pseudomonadota bacterium]